MLNKNFEIIAALICLKQCTLKYAEVSRVTVEQCICLLEVEHLSGFFM